MDKLSGYEKINQGLLTELSLLLDRTATCFLKFEFLAFLITIVE